MINNNVTESEWIQLRGALKARWIKLTDDDLQVPTDGNVDYLADKLQERYGIGRDEALQQLDLFEVKKPTTTFPACRRPCDRG